MVATAPETKRRAAGLARSVPRGLADRHRRGARGPRAGDGPPPADASTSRRPTTSQGRRGRGQGRPARLGRDAATRSAPRSCAARRRSTRRIGRSSGRGRSARPARIRNKMHHEQNFTAGEAARRGDDAVAAVRLARADRPAGAPVDDPPRPGRASSARSRRGTRRACWACASSRPALALGNAVILKPDPQTPVCGGAMFAAVFKEAGLPDGLLQVVIGDAETGEALVTDPNVNLVSLHRARRRSGGMVGAEGGRPAQEGQPGAGRQQPVDRAGRRGPGRRRRARARIASVPVPGPGLLRHRAAHRPSQRRRRVRRPARRRRRGGCAPATRTARTSSSARSSTSSSSSASTASSGARSTRAARGSSRAARTRACSTDPPF